VEDIQQLEQDRGCQETAGMPNDQNPLYDSAAGSGRVVGAPSHGPESAHKATMICFQMPKLLTSGMPERRQKPKPPTPVPWEPKQGGGEGPRSPDVSKPDTKDLLKRMRKVDPNQSRRYRQRTGE